MTKKLLAKMMRRLIVMLRLRTLTRNDLEAFSRARCVPFTGLLKHHAKKKKKPCLKTHADEDEDEEDVETSDQDSASGSEEKLDFDPSDDEEMPEALDVLDQFVSNLDVTSKKRKATEEPREAGAGPDIRAHKRRLMKERTEAGAENEFRARSSGVFYLFTSS